MIKDYCRILKEFRNIDSYAQMQQVGMARVLNSNIREKPPSKENFLNKNPLYEYNRKFALEPFL